MKVDENITQIIGQSGRLGMNIAVVLLIKITLKGCREDDDILVYTSRVLTFPPTEGLTLVLTNEQDEEHEITLGAPRYEFAESAFVEYMEDNCVIEEVREGKSKEEATREAIEYYKSFGFSARRIYQKQITASTAA